jgi:hypothetical protein
MVGIVAAVMAAGAATGQAEEEMDQAAPSTGIHAGAIKLARANCLKSSNLE